MQLKIHAKSKLKTLHKHEMNSLQLPLGFEEKPRESFESEIPKVEKTEMQYLEDMLGMLVDRNEFLLESVETLKRENTELLKANL